MKLCIADPPYLGRARRWYGVPVPGAGAFGSGGGRHRADEHDDAAVWDDPARHGMLVEELVDNYDGWAVALDVGSLAVYLAAAPSDVRVMAWAVPNRSPAGSRLTPSWEPVLVRVPPSRMAHRTGVSRRDYLLEPATRQGFTGAKPPRWTRWVLDVLGYDPMLDEVVDLFPGSGAVDLEVRSLVFPFGVES